MSGSYRLVQFMVDPFSGTRFPLGAMVQDNGRVEFTAASLLPGAECLGSDEAAVLARLLIDDLHAATNFEQLPQAIGPQVVLGPENALPSSVEPAVWVAKHILPRPAKTKRTGAPRAKSRMYFGNQFFSFWKVDGWVCKTFEPGKDLPGWLAGRSFGLDTISHYVPGRSEVLLMEPIVPKRGDKFEMDLRTVAQRFLAYRGVAQDMEADRPTPRLVAYVLAGKEERRTLAKNALAGSADVVFDTSLPNERDQFLGRVEAVGQSADGLADLWKHS